MKVRFVKMHGAGNDFVMIDNREGAFAYDRERIAAIASRPDGIGSEGVIFVERSETADFRMRFFNPDGGEAELCGNGARCVAAFARRIGAVAADAMRFETQAGVVAAELLGADRVRIAMPAVKDLAGDFVNSGVPHFIVPVADLTAVDVEREGRSLRYAPRFAPAGTNVDFVHFDDAHTLHLRTYERGVEAESGACGTGAVAAAAVGVAGHGLQYPVTVHTRYGYELTVDAGPLLIGPVKTVFAGEIEV